MDKPTQEMRIEACPFCGGSARYWDGGYPKFIECSKCGVSLGEEKNPNLITAWNTLTLAPLIAHLTQEVERLQEALKKLIASYRGVAEDYTHRSCYGEIIDDICAAEQALASSKREG